MPKPKGTTGSTKMKILSVICFNQECGNESYGYNIWLDLKQSFFMYMNDNDIRNVYHHLNDLCRLGYLQRDKTQEESGKCLYHLTNTGLNVRPRFDMYLEAFKQRKSEV